MTQNDFTPLLAASAPIIAPVIGEIVSGIVIHTSHKMVLIDINGQFTGVISGSHLHSSTEDVSQIKTGDIVESIVIGDDRESGLFILSLRKASQIKLIAKLHSNFDTKEIITVIPNEANK